MYGCQPVMLNPEAGTQAILEYLCSESNKVYNSSLYYARQLYFKTKRFAGRAAICSEMAKSKNRHFGAIYVSAAQQTCNAVAEALKSYRELLKLWNRGELAEKPKLPNYRKGGLFTVSYPKRWLKLTDDGIRIPLGTQVNHCLKNGIGRIVFGWNQGQKSGANMGRKTNQKFVQIPTARLKTRIAQLCEVYGIELIEYEEANTSAASFLDGDSLPAHGEKPEGWKSSGRRVKRGLFRTAQNWYINADCNGAANVIRKVAATLGLDLSGVSRGALTSPLRVRFWAVQESPSL